MAAETGAEYKSVLQKMQNPGSPNRPFIHGWWLCGPCQFWVVCQSIICWDYEINKKKGENELTGICVSLEAQVQMGIWYQCICEIV